MIRLFIMCIFAACAILLSACMSMAQGNSASAGMMQRGRLTEQSCDRVCDLTKRNEALEDVVANFKKSLAARDVYITALKLEVARLKSGGQ